MPHIDNNDIVPHHPHQRLSLCVQINPLDVFNLMATQITAFGMTSTILRLGPLAVIFNWPDMKVKKGDVV